MLTELTTLSHQQQQEAVERIQQLVAGGMSTGEAIAQVAADLRQTSAASCSLNINKSDDATP